MAPAEVASWRSAPRSSRIWFLGYRHGDLDDTVGDPERVDPHGSCGRGTLRPASGEAESGTVHPALDIPVLDVALGQGDLPVAALILQGMHRSGGPGQADPLPGQFDRDCRVIAQVHQPRGR